MDKSGKRLEQRVAVAFSGICYKDITHLPQVDADVGVIMATPGIHNQ